MKKIILLLALFVSEYSIAQNTYWQQYLHYTIDAQLTDRNKTITGSETIVYKNNSPETLTYIWFHIYPNAYKNEKTALFQQIYKIPSRKAQLKYIRGFITGLAFTANGIPAKTEPHPNPQYIDIIKVVLNAPLVPGDSVTIATPFKVRLPSYFSRSGFANGEFMACQWYPKPAVFDKNGWHEMPYLDMGEFYSEYASYKVNITLPSEYVVAATGVLSTPAEAALYQSIGSYNAANPDNKNPRLYSPSFEKTKMLSYVADSVPDFAWFANKKLVIQYNTIQLPSGKIIEAYTYYHKNRNTPWNSSMAFVKDAVHHYSNWIGEYAYPLVQAVEGPANNASGGMEYPMITLVTIPDARPEALDGVITHEVGHNWFMSMLGTNERDYAWMDEGLNSYYQFRYEAEKYRANSIFGDRIPARIRKRNETDFQAAVYHAMEGITASAAIETTSASFANSRDYALTTYVKPAQWMYMLEKTIGRQKVDTAFQNYFKRWKFKHPQPSDMKAAFEQSVNKSLETFFGLLNKEGALL
jgi:hypothetical protein